MAFTMTFETDSAAFEENGLPMEVEYVLKRVANFRSANSDTPLEQGVAEKGRILDSNGGTIGEWEYLP